MVLRVCLMVLVVLGGSHCVCVEAAPLAHIAGAARKIRMYIKNSYLELSQDGTVSGARDASSHRTLLQRSSVDRGQVKIQGVTTCMYLCMDTCGLPYASKEFTDECVFNETMEQHNYNTYSSAKYSNARRTLYLALNKRGHPRRVQVRAGSGLGKLSTYTRVLPHPVSREELEGRGGGAPKCPATPSSAVPRSQETGRCRRPRRRRRKRKRCREEDAECVRRRKAAASAAAQAHRVRHRKHRTPSAEPEEEQFTEDEFFEDQTDHFLDLLNESD